MKNGITRFALVAAATLSATQAQAAVLVVNVTGIQTNAGRGNPGNTVQLFNIGAGSRVTDVAYNLNLTAFDPSYLSEAFVVVTDSGYTVGVRFAPGGGNNFAGTGNYARSFDLEALNLGFNVGQDGLLRLEYYESLDDASVNPDARFNSGSVSFTYDLAAATPEPAAWALMIGGFGAAGGMLRRRRRANGALATA